jgi:hypothetical protein
MAKARITLEERPRRMAMLETKMRYAVMLDGVEFSEVYWNMQGYCGAVPYKKDDGSIGRFSPGEISLAKFKREIAQANRELQASDATA